MKTLIYLFALVGLISCKDGVSTDVYIFNNTTDHVIDMVFYHTSSTTIEGEKTTITLEQRQTDNSISTSGRRGNPGTITEKYDSVRVTYDDTVSITHPSQFGKPINYTDNQILNYGSWIFIQAVEEKKKHHRRDLIYTFTEQDYLNAL